nr:hypothetical protein [Tanacetum cinerariifolium]
MEEHISCERKIQRYYEADSKRKKEYRKTIAVYIKERVTRRCQDRKFPSNSEARTTQNVDKASSLASRVLLLFKTSRKYAKGLLLLVEDLMLLVQVKAVR